MQVSKLAALNVALFWLMNFSLRHNTLGFHTFALAMTIPAMVTIEVALSYKYQSREAKAALFTVCLGAFLTGGEDFGFNLVGAAYAVTYVLVHSFSVIWIGSLQESLECSPLQLLTYVAPLSALYSVPLIPIIDGWQASDFGSIWNYKFYPEIIVILVLYGIIAFLVISSCYLVIAKSSAVSYKVLGYFANLAGGLFSYVMFGIPLSLKEYFGFLLRLSGILWYLSLKLERARIEKDVRGRNRNYNSMSTATASATVLGEGTQLYAETLGSRV